MAIPERELEEDEAKIDNILHKIMLSSEQIVTLANEMSQDAQKNTILKEKFHLISGTISNLALLADELTLHEEKITEELEITITQELGTAIDKIKEIKNMFDENNQKKSTS